ncbi:MAG: transporter, ATP-binding protein [Bacillales bacterium]|jgi:ATP-binding cassette subfamily B protein|nr:transporter, ATP-binding protein [Bacillales bacterium]
MTEQSNSPNLNSKIIIRLIKYTLNFKNILFYSFFSLFIATTLEIISPLIIKQFIDEHLIKKNFERNAIVTLFIIYICVLLVKVIFSYCQVYYFQRLAMEIISKIRADLFKNVIKQPIDYFNNTPNGSIVSRVTNDTESIKDFYVSVLGAIVQNGLMIIGTLIAMFYLNVKLAFYFMAFIPIIFIVINLYRKLSSKYYHQMREQLSKLNAKLNESIQGMEIIQTFVQERRMRKDFELTNDNHYDAGIKNLKIDSLLLRPAIDFLYVISIIVIISFFGANSFISTVEIGLIYVFINYTERFFEPINQFMNKLSMFQQAIVSGIRVFDLVDEDVDNLNYAISKTDSANISRNIKFENVSFSYDGTTNVLNDLTFEIKENQTVAFVGHTGSGKSTIMNLLLRFYKPTSGKIIVGDTDILNLNYKELREGVGLVIQEPHIFSGTIKQNIKMYKKSMDDETIIKSASLVQAHDFIDSLPEKYDSQVSERGSNLSMGQKQLISFARIIAANPKVLIMDEATANIDTETEEKIQMALTKMRVGRTTIMIAHRLSTIQDADIIYVLKKGEIVESGNHDQLIEQKGNYYKMYKAQSSQSSLAR